MKLPAVSIANFKSAAMAVCSAPVKAFRAFGSGLRWVRAQTTDRLLGTSANRAIRDGVHHFKPGSSNYCTLRGLDGYSVTRSKEAVFVDNYIAGPLLHVLLEPSKELQQ